MDEVEIHSKRQEGKKLPEHLKPFFWDVDFEGLTVCGARPASS